MRLRRTHRLGLANHAGPRSGISRIAILLSMVSVLGYGRFTLAKERRDGDPLVAAQSTVRITARIYNYARIPKPLLDRAESEASTIFRKAGIEVEWLDCPLTEAEMPLYPACHGDLGAADFVLNLLPESMAERAALRDTTFGFAQLSSDGGRSYVASVFWDRITEAAQSGDLSAYQLLGHAVAHEIGHLLLGSMGHARTGLMRVNWGPPELNAMARKYLLFTPKQSERMRAEMLARMRQEQLWARRGEPAEHAHQDRRGEYEASNRR